MAKKELIPKTDPEPEQRSLYDSEPIVETGPVQSATAESYEEVSCHPRDRINSLVAFFRMKYQTFLTKMSLLNLQQSCCPSSSEWRMGTGRRKSIIEKTRQHVASFSDSGGPHTRSDLKTLKKQRKGFEKSTVLRKAAIEIKVQYMIQFFVINRASKRHMTFKPRQKPLNHLAQCIGGGTVNV